MPFVRLQKSNHSLLLNGRIYNIKFTQPFQVLKVLISSNSALLATLFSFLRHIYLKKFYILLKKSPIKKSFFLNLDQFQKSHQIFKPHLEVLKQKLILKKNDVQSNQEGFAFRLAPLSFYKCHPDDIHIQLTFRYFISENDF